MTLTPAHNRDPGKRDIMRITLSDAATATTVKLWHLENHPGSWSVSVKVAGLRILMTRFEAVSLNEAREKTAVEMRIALAVDPKNLLPNVEAVLFHDALTSVGVAGQS